MPPSQPVFSRQPGRSLYTLYTILSSLIRVPTLFLWYIPRFMRPNPKWTYYQSLSNAFTKIVFHYLSVIEVKTSQSIQPGLDPAHFPTIHPADHSFYHGPLEDPEIKPAVVGGIWLPSPYDAMRDAHKTVVLHFHGGAYVFLSPRSSNVQWGPQVLVDELSTPVLMVDYRLASNAGGRFPAALQDAVTAYKYLLDLGIVASRIVLSGDSAGGHLSLALLRYISEHERKGLSALPCPSGAMLWSPWADVSRSPASYAAHRNYRTDYITPALISWAQRTYSSPSRSLSDPYITPLKHPFATTAKLFVQVGTSEVMADDIVGLAKTMGDVRGNQVMVSEVGNGNHATFAAGAGLGFETEARAAARAAGRFLGMSGGI